MSRPNSPELEFVSYIRTAPAPFNAPADLILRTAQQTRYHVPSAILALASPYFRALLPLPPGGAEHRGRRHAPSASHGQEWGTGDGRAEGLRRWLGRDYWCFCSVLLWVSVGRGHCLDCVTRREGGVSNYNIPDFHVEARAQVRPICVSFGLP